MTARAHHMVAEFATTFGHPHNTTPTLPNRRTRKLRLTLLQEEYDETMAAALIPDIVEVADGLGDIAYIAHGTLHAYGFTYDPRVVQGKVGLREAVRLYTDMERRFLRGEMGEFTGAELDLAKWNTVLHRALNQILVEVKFVARDYGIPFMKVFEDIHFSNMSKLWPADDTSPVPYPKFRADGKVLKGPHTRKPNILQILIDDGHPIYAEAAA